MYAIVLEASQDVFKKSPDFSNYFLLMYLVALLKEQNPTV